MHAGTGWLAGLALLPFAASLGIDLAIALGFRFGTTVGSLIGAALGLIALFLWYGLEFVMRRHTQSSIVQSPTHATPLVARVQSMLTDARVLLSGAQALFGFQMTILFTDRFDALSDA
jgi:hypothetical protein